MPPFAHLRRRCVYFFHRWLLWGGRVRPARMYRNGRPVVPDLENTEKLYFRCLRSSIDTSGRIKHASIRFPDQSVNREKFSSPTDVLLPDKSKSSKDWILWGVAFVIVSDVPSELISDGGIYYSFTAEHDPLDDNYGHTELRAYKSGKRESKKKKINKTVQKEYRVKLAFRTKVAVQPLV